MLKMKKNIQLKRILIVIPLREPQIEISGALRAPALFLIYYNYAFSVTELSLWGFRTFP